MQSSSPVPITYASPVYIPLVVLPTSQQYSTSCHMVNGMGHPGVVANAPPPPSALLLEDNRTSYSTWERHPTSSVRFRHLEQAWVLGQPWESTTSWSPWSPDLTHPDLFFCGFVHGEVYVPGNLIGLNTKSGCETEQPCLHSVWHRVAHHLMSALCKDGNGASIETRGCRSRGGEETWWVICCAFHFSVPILLLPAAGVT